MQFVHVMAGRLRIKVPAVKCAPDEARELEARLRMIPGIEDATANPVTGSVLILYDTDQTGLEPITEQLETWGYLRHAAPAPDAPGGPVGGLGGLFLRATTEVALQHLITALI